MSRWIDITVPLSARTTAWPGDRAFELSHECAIENGAGCNLSSFAMSAHLGTHMDAPLHYFERGESMDALPFEAVIGPARVLEIGSDRVTAADLERHSIREGERILLKTRNSARAWRDEPFRNDYTHIDVCGAQHLAERRPALIGADYLSVGGPGAGGEQVHRLLLGAGVWIAESLDLSGVEPGDYELICLPLRLADVEGAPARALLRRA